MPPKQDKVPTPSIKTFYQPSKKQKTKEPTPETESEAEPEPSTTNTTTPTPTSTIKETQTAKELRALDKDVAVETWERLRDGWKGTGKGYEAAVVNEAGCILCQKPTNREVSLAQELQSTLLTAAVGQWLYPDYPLV